MAGINWTPTRDIRFRANLGTSVRQPAIVEAFGGQTVSFAPGADPCDAGQITSYGALAGTVAANCARQGIKVGTFTQPGSQIATLVGGNPALQPETSRTYTIGTVLTPRFLKNFSATIDYFHTKIENSIGTLPSQSIVDACYESTGLSSSLCNLIAPRSATGQLVQVQALEENLGEVRTSGIDFDINYLIRLRGGHVLSFSNELVDTIGYTEQLQPDGPWVNLKGRMSAINTQTYLSGYPVIRDNLTATYSKGPFSFSWTTRFIDGMIYNDGSNDAVVGVDRYARVNEAFFHDILATYNFKKIQFIAGIDNLFDRTPPFALDGSTNTAPNVYGEDILGRLFYAKMQFRF
jgi:outer membrane receptor protein involved in Fe transport